jgi:hypothetical protein
MILAPESGYELDRDSTLQLQGQGYWLEERRPEVEALFWSSSLGGALGRGANVEVSGLQTGVHEIPSRPARATERAARRSRSSSAESDQPRAEPAVTTRTQLRS